MSPTDALIILHAYGNMPYKNKAASVVCYEAQKVLTEEATRLMQEHTRPLCSTCWGDGFHRLSDSILSGPCEVCGGSGKRAA